MGPSEIQDYGVIGDCRAAALVSRAGSVDWLCWPRFDSPPVFGALLDPERGGHLRLTPTGPFWSRQRYLGPTNVLETRFGTRTGRARVIDLMPVYSEEEKDHLLVPEHELVRVIEGELGEVELTLEALLRFDFRPVRLHACHPETLGLRASTPEGDCILRTDAPLFLDTDGTARARFRIRAGERIHISLILCSDGPAVLPPLAEGCDASLQRTLRWWRGWAARAKYDGPYRDQVVRSALALKLLAYAPSGAIVAAPTTSLPEAPGGGLNWDYRYCWLRDASATARAFLGLGFLGEAEAFVGWLMSATRLTHPRLNVLYDLHGRQPAGEQLRPELAGYLGARPVRIGNAAQRQLQLDIYGEVLDAAMLIARAGGGLQRHSMRVLVDLASHVAGNWERPDQGIWEIRHAGRRHTHSLVQCWAALDQAVSLAMSGLTARAPVERFIHERRRIRDAVEARAWNPRLGAYAGTLEGEEVDAATLLMARAGYLPANDLRLRATYERILRDLGGGRPGLLYRNPALRGLGDRPFVVCGFWAAEYLALGGGSLAEATRTFEGACLAANDLGLLAEEVDPERLSPMGNFPQGFSHLGLINAALLIEQRRCAIGHRGPPSPPWRTGAPQEGHA